MITESEGILIMINNIKIVKIIGDRSHQQTKDKQIRAVSNNLPYSVNPSNQFEKNKYLKSRKYLQILIDVILQENR